MVTKTRIFEIVRKSGVPITIFCKRVGLSRTAFYRWLRDDLKLSDGKEQAIRMYASKLSQICE